MKGCVYRIVQKNIAIRPRTEDIVAHKVALTGIKPTGTPHVGNYLGAIRQLVDLQAEHENLVFIADYHSMNTVRSAEDRRSFTRAVALDYLACGIDPARTMLFRQSDIPEVTELTWMLSTVTPMGLLERSHARALPDRRAVHARPVRVYGSVAAYESEVLWAASATLARD